MLKAEGTAREQESGAFRDSEGCGVAGCEACGSGVGVSWERWAGPQSHRPLRAIAKRSDVILSVEGSRGGFWSRAEAVKVGCKHGEVLEGFKQRAMTWSGCYFRRISPDETEGWWLGQVAGPRNEGRGGVWTGAGAEDSGSQPWTDPEEALGPGCLLAQGNPLDGAGQISPAPAPQDFVSFLLSPLGEKAHTVLLITFFFF